MDKAGNPATITSEEGYLPQWGILNALGHFWTSRTFDAPVEARAYIRDFWGTNTASRDQCLKTHRIVPVLVVVTEIPELASDRDGAEGGDANAAPVPQDRHARAEGIAQPQSESKP